MKGSIFVISLCSKRGLPYTPASWEGILEMKWLLAEALTLLCMGLKIDPTGFEILHQVGRPREQVENLEVTLPLRKNQLVFLFDKDKD
jgi:hypothetical protein